MRGFRGKLRFGVLLDIIILAGLVALLIVFLKGRGPSMPRIEISFQSANDGEDIERTQRDVDEPASKESLLWNEVDVDKNAPEEEGTDENVRSNKRQRRLRPIEENRTTPTPSPSRVRSKIQIDTRSARCRQTKYDAYGLKKSTSLVVQFTDYEFYDAEVTLSSVLDDVDKVDRIALADIILVDAGSTLDHVRREAREYVASLRLKQKRDRRTDYLPSVRLIRVESEPNSDGGDSTRLRGSRMWPREVGAEAARTDVVVFVDAGVIVGRGWLAPLVSPLLEKKGRSDHGPSAVESHLDRLRNPVSLDYRSTDEDLVPVPSWSLAVRMRRIPVVRQDDKQSKPDEVTETPPYRPIPVLRGSAFAVRVADLESIGGLFDEGLDVEGGGEHLELSLRLWMCGSGIQQATCSRVGVPDIDDEVRIVSPMNVGRVVDTWFPTRRAFIERFGGHRAASVTSDRRGSVALESGMCKDIDWYMKTAAMGSLIQPSKDDSTQFGGLQVMSGSCARVGDDNRIDLDPCTLDRVPSPDSVFELTSDGALLAARTGLCLTVTKTLYISTEECQHPLKDRQKWQFNAGGELSNELAGLCATHVTDPSDDRDVRQIMMAQKCHLPNDNSYEQFKTWHFVSV